MKIEIEKFVKGRACHVIRKVIENATFDATYYTAPYAARATTRKATWDAALEATKKARAGYTERNKKS